MSITHTSGLKRQRDHLMVCNVQATGLTYNQTHNVLSSGEWYFYDPSEVLELVFLNSGDQRKKISCSNIARRFAFLGAGVVRIYLSSPLLSDTLNLESPLDPQIFVRLPTWAL